MERYRYSVIILVFVLCSFMLTQTIVLGGDAMELTITSSAFEPNESIPSQYTCDGEDLSPPLSWSNTPADTRSFVLICDDPDAPMGTWVHWVLYDIPAEVRSLEENIPADAVLPNGAMHGMTDFRRLGYGGPCPPSGTHRYFFKLYALDTVLGQEPGLRKDDVLTAIEGHVLEKSELVGTYKRQ